MGNVAVTLNVMPDSPEADLEKMKEEIKNRIGNGIKLEQINEKPVAFGLKRLEVLLTMPDNKGTSDLEEAISKIEGVASVEPGEITLL
jgi:elongation factor 1-beta